MVDLEKLSKRCREQNRWTFFVTSSPANCPGKSVLSVVLKVELTSFTGGVSSHLNAIAIL